jgi:hypothetical protein
VLINAHPFALHPGKANQAKPLLAKPAHRDWRTEFYDAIAGPKLQAVVAFGDQAQARLAGTRGPALVSRATVTPTPLGGRPPA